MFKKFLTEFLPMVVGIALLWFGIMFGLKIFVGVGDYDKKQVEECRVYGEMVHLPTKRVGYNCYVEYTTDKWVEQTYYDIEQRNAYLTGQ